MRREAAAPAVRVAGAVKAFGARRALDGVGLELAPGEQVGLLGPNGAGKTTLMRAVAGLVTLDAGSVELRGSARVGYVPQEIALYPLLTARENLDAFGRLHGVRGASLRERVAWALHWTGLERRAAARVDTLSGGMRRRLNIACGVLHDPGVVLLDEPAVGVDPEAREQIWRMLDDLKAAGAALMHSSHELHEIESVCDRVVVMCEGRVVAEGTVDELVARVLDEPSRARVRVDRPPAAADLPRGARVAGRIVEAAVSDVEGELPALLGALREAGCRVRNVSVDASGLAELFARLTGRELVS